MAAPTASLPTVGTYPHPPGTTIVFCNGIMNNIEAATESAALISSSFDYRKVAIFHNPTALGDVINPDNSTEKQQSKMALLLAKKIHRFIKHQKRANITDGDIHILLFAHSHGAVVTHRALSHLNETDRKKIDVHAFGGASMIPKGLARIVINYVFEADMIAEIGTLISDNALIMKSMKGIIKDQEKRGDPTPDKAIYIQAYRDTCQQISPPHSGNADKKSRYQKIVKEQNQAALESDPYFIKRREMYTSLFHRYALILLPREEASRAKKSGASDNFLRRTFKALKSLGKEVLSSHQFASYANALGLIAQLYSQTQGN